MARRPNLEEGAVDIVSDFCCRGPGQVVWPTCRASEIEQGAFSSERSQRAGLVRSLRMWVGCAGNWCGAVEALMVAATEEIIDYGVGRQNELMRSRVRSLVM